MKDENVNRGSVHVSDDVLYICIPLFLVLLLCIFRFSKDVLLLKKKVMLSLCINLKTFWWDFVLTSLQLFSSLWSDVEPGFKPRPKPFELKGHLFYLVTCFKAWRQFLCLKSMRETLFLLARDRSLCQNGGK